MLKRVYCNHVLTDVDEFDDTYCLECGDVIEKQENNDEDEEYDHEF